MKVSQPVSLSTAYATPENPEGVEQGKLANSDVKVSKSNVPRAFKVKGLLGRFASRTLHEMKARRLSSDADQAENERVSLFNEKHKKFSDKITNVVDRLKSGIGTDVRSAKVLATLRNDVKWMNKNQPWAERTDLLARRIDLELSKLTQTELETVAGQLNEAHLAKGLTSKDKADIRTMQRAVVRQLLARHPKLMLVLQDLQSHTTHEVRSGALLEHMKDIKHFVAKELQRFGIEDPQVEPDTTDENGIPLPPPPPKPSVDVLSAGFHMAVQRWDLGEQTLKELNTNLLDVERHLFIQDSVELSSRSPELLHLSSSVRQEFLLALADTYKDEHLDSRMSELGQGAVNTVTKGTYKVGEETQTKVHKSDQQDLGKRFWAPRRIRIDQSNTRLLERGVFCSKLDEKLDFNVVVRTDFARHRDKIGIVMDLAEGKPARSLGRVGNLVPKDSDPGIAQREMMKMQLIDIITGQTDRHAGNYLVQRNEKGEVTGIKAIDNDFCMGGEPNDPNQLSRLGGCHAVGMPPLVDEVMAKAILNLTEMDIRKIGEGLLDTESLDAAVSRLLALQDHVTNLAKESCVISPELWGSKEALYYLNDRRTEENNFTSYWRRDYSDMLSS